jgi:hypothetical protein
MFPNFFFLISVETKLVKIQPQALFGLMRAKHVLDDEYAKKSWISVNYTMPSSDLRHRINLFSSVL